MVGWFKVLVSTLALAAAWPAAQAQSLEPEPLLPDLFAWKSIERGYMYEGQFDTSTGRALYRFDVAIPNIGFGPFEIHEITDTENDVQHIYQRIYDSAGGFEQRYVWSFENPEPAFGHLYFVGLAQYNLRSVMEGGGVGPIVSSHDKTSFGLVDSVAYALQLPDAPQSRQYVSANSHPVGVSVGWADLYGSGLPGQWVDASGLPSGQYWLEVVIDPYEYVDEYDESNNTTQVLVDLVVPSVPGDYDGNGTVGLEDYPLWRETLGQAGPGLAADGNGDDMITQADYQYWLDRYGNTYGSEGAASGGAFAVPEPSGWQLAVFVLCGALGWRKARRHRPIPLSPTLTW